jgi:hypothetical protein
MTAPTDDDIRAELRGAAFKGAKLLSMLVDPELDPRAFPGGELPDKSDLHRMQRGAETCIAAWAKTLPNAAPDVPASQLPPRAAAVALFRARPAELLEAIHEAGFDLVPRAVETTGEEKR